MTKNLEKIDVFWDLDLESILGGFWKGFGGNKNLDFRAFGQVFGKVREERRERKKKKEKREGREGPNTQLSSLTLGRYLYKGDFGCPASSFYTALAQDGLQEAF